MVGLVAERTDRRVFASNLSGNMAHAGYKHLENGNVNEGRELLRSAAESQRLIGWMEDNKYRRRLMLMKAQAYALTSGDASIASALSIELTMSDGRYSAMFSRAEPAYGNEHARIEPVIIEKAEGPLCSYSYEIPVTPELAGQLRKSLHCMPEPYAMLTDRDGPDAVITFGVYKERNAVAFASSHEEGRHEAIKKAIRNVAMIYEEYSRVEHLVRSSKSL